MCCLLLEPDLKARAKAAAAQDRRTFQDYVAVALEQQLGISLIRSPQPRRHDDCA
jgi:hypothetical protein